jgi:O-succinylbenzoate synthase
VLVSVLLDDGSRGWGECPALHRPSYTSEYAAGAFAVLRDVLVPGHLAGGGERVVGHAMARGALDDALVDALLRRQGRSLASALGVTASHVELRAIVSGSTVGELVSRVGERVDDGYRRIGVKVGPGWLEEPLRALRSTFPALGIAVDCNGSLDPGDVEATRVLDACQVDEVEQPCRARDWIGLTSVANRLEADVVLDESVEGPDDLHTAVRLGAAGVVNVKPARVGGLRRAVTLVGLAADLGLEAFVGGMLESGIGRAGALTVAALPDCTRASHLGPSAHYFDPDLTEPHRLGPGARLAVPTGVGIGVIPAPDLLDTLTVERAVLVR